MRNKLWIILPIVFTIFLSFKTMFTYGPEMLNYPFFMSRGFVPYKDFSMVYTSLLPAALQTIFGLTGYDPQILHLLGTLFLSLTVAGATMTIYHFSKGKLTSLLLGLFLSYALLCFESNQFWFDSLLPILFLAIFLLELSFASKPKWWKITLAGLITGITILIKQTAALSLLSFIPYLLLLRHKNELSIRKILSTFFWFTTPLILVLLLFFAWLVSQNILWDFWNWGVRFIFAIPRADTIGVAPYLHFPSLRQSVALILFLLPPIVLALRKNTLLSLLLVTWTLTTFLLAFPNFAYSRLEPSLFFSFLTLGIVSTGKKSSRWPLFLYLIVTATIGTSIFLRHLRVDQPYYDDDVKQVASYINENYPNQSLYSFHGPDLVYVLTKKPPAFKPWLDQLSWQMAFAGEENFKILKSSPPDVVVYRPFSFETLQEKAMFNYFKNSYTNVFQTQKGTQILERLSK